MQYVMFFKCGQKYKWVFCLLCLVLKDELSERCLGPSNVCILSIFKMADLAKIN